MSILDRFRTVSESDKARAVEKLISDSTPDFDFFFLVILSVMMATFGLILDNVAIIIGSMLIAPILYPLLSLSLGLVISEYSVINRSLYTVLKSLILGIISAIIVTLLFVPAEREPGFEILLRVSPSLEYFMVAIIAGVAVSYSLVKPKLSATIAGIAISTALIPPIAVVGIGFAQLSWSIVSGSFVLFLINVIGIVFASMFLFSLIDLHGKRKVVETTIKREDKRVEREAEKVEKLGEEQS